LRHCDLKHFREAAMPNQIPRNHLQFRLRTLLIVVTVFCAATGWIAKQVHIVRERKAFIASTPEPALYWFDDRDDRGPAIPFVRRLLGDRGYESIGMQINSTKEERDRAAKLFPEATIMAINPDYPFRQHIISTFKPMLIQFPKEPRAERATWDPITDASDPPPTKGLSVTP
jgi:hypothetical protein